MSLVFLRSYYRSIQGQRINKRAICKSIEERDRTETWTCTPNITYIQIQRYEEQQTVIMNIHTVWLDAQAIQNNVTGYSKQCDRQFKTM